MKQHTKFLALGGATAIMLAVATQAANAISVYVNGNPVRFTGTPPTQIQGSVLVPLRGVFEALGASVNYNPVTKTINAEKGSSNVTLTLGQTVAMVNGQGQTLSQPAQTIGGTTLVPLRFVAQALGASVQWVAATQTVEIKTADPHLATLPTAPGTGAVVGQLTGVYANADPQTVTVRVNGQNTVVPLSANTIILRSAPGLPGMQVALNQLQPGDQVTVQRGGDGNALSITASYGEVRGTIKSISGAIANGNQIITLNDGTTVEVVPHVPVLMAGRNVTLADLMPNENVVIRTNPGNKLGFGVAVVTEGNPNPTPPGQIGNPGPQGA
nr:copper amine oxidase N-terminal domain-containing protein [Armatimonadota bacterium]